MARSIAEVQAELLSEGTLDRLGSAKVPSDAIPVIEELIIRSAAEFVLAVRENLDKDGKVSTGGLTDGVAAGELRKSGSTLTIEIGYDKSDPAALYWDYVNQGVKGLDSGQPAGSDYSFKTRKVVPVMAEAIYQWVKKNNISAQNEDQRRNISSLQKKRQDIRSLGDPRMGLAYAIAAKIKRRGLPYTGFWDKAVKEYLGKKFAQAVAKAGAADIRLQVRKFNPAGK